MTAVLFDRAMQTPLPNVKLICPLSSNQTDYGKLVMLDCRTVYGTISWVSPLCPVSHASSLFIQSRENRASERSSQGGSHCLWNNNLNKRFKALYPTPRLLFLSRENPASRFSAIIPRWSSNWRIFTTFNGAMTQNAVGLRTQLLV